MSARNVFLVLLLFLAPTGLAQQVSVKGYASALGGLSLPRSLSPAYADAVLQHRHETVLRWGAAFRVNADVRSRWLTGHSMAPHPLVGQALTRDGGMVDLNHLWGQGHRNVVHSHIDRLQASYLGERFEVHVGRQRVNWGRTMVWNPNDLFNPYAWLDFDYPERGGTDALRLVVPQGYAGGMEAVVSRGRSRRETTAAVLLRAAFSPHEVQILAGSYQRTPVLGLGWAGNAGEMALAAEATAFFRDTPHVTASLGLSTLWAGNVFATAELLYNGAPRHPARQVFEAPQPDRPFFSDTGVFLSATHQASPLVNLSLAVLASATEPLRVWMPQATVSLSDQWDASLILQHVEGRLSRPIPTPTAVFVRIQRSYASR